MKMMLIDVEGDWWNLLQVHCGRVDTLIMCWMQMCKFTGKVLGRAVWAEDDVDDCKNAVEQVMVNTGCSCSVQGSDLCLLASA